MKKTILYISAALFGIVSAAGIVWLRAAPASAPAAASPAAGQASVPGPALTQAALSATPAYVVVNTPTQVLFTTPNANPLLLPNGINLLKTDAAGKTVAIIGVMLDNGTNGDAVANDKIFSYRLALNETAVGFVNYRASAAFKGVLQRVQSPNTTVTVDPFLLPPDPGETGKQTLKGIDSDGDGVRDDIQRYIAITYPNADERRALLQYARSLQSVIATGTDPTDAVSEQLAATWCAVSVLGATAADRAIKLALSRALNTMPRLRAYATTRDAVPIDQLHGVRTSTYPTFCTP